MRTVVISLFTEDDVDPLYETFPDADTLGIQVLDGDGYHEPDAYDFRLSGPVNEDVLEEVTQLLNDLIHHHVAEAVGLQPALF